MHLGEYAPKKLLYYRQLKFKVHTQNNKCKNPSAQRDASVNQICIRGLKERARYSKRVRENDLFISSLLLEPRLFINKEWLN